MERGEKIKTNHFNRLLIVLLSFVMLFVGIISPNFIQKSYADDTEEEIDYDTLLTGNDISDEYIEQLDEQVTDLYLEYIYLDNSHIRMSTTPIEQKYGSIILLDDFITDMIDIDDDDDYFHIATVRMIHRNMEIMNELVDDEDGYIDENFEFFFWDTSTLARFRAWNFQLKWNKITADFDKDFAVIASTIILIFRLRYDLREGISDIDDLIDKYYDDRDQLIVDLLLKVFIDLPSGIAVHFIAKQNEALAQIGNLSSMIIENLQNIPTFKKCLKKLLFSLIPDIKDSLSILYNSLFYQKGASIKVCWLPTYQDKWGISIKSI